jgi:hypothetical protein
VPLAFCVVSQLHVPSVTEPGGTSSSNQTTSPVGKLEGAGAVPRTHGWTASVAVRLTPERLAVRVTVVCEATLVVVMVKVAVVEPCGTVTLAGTEATEGFELERSTVLPPGGAALLRVTVPVAEVPPGMLAGLTLTDERPAMVTVSDAVLVIVKYFAERVAEPAATAVAVKVAEVAPAGTLTEEGTVATDVAELVRVTLAPAGGA